MLRLTFHFLRNGSNNALSKFFPDCRVTLSCHCWRELPNNESINRATSAKSPDCSACAHAVEIEMLPGRKLSVKVRMRPTLGSSSPATGVKLPQKVRIRPLCGSISPSNVRISPFLGSTSPSNVRMRPTWGAKSPSNVRINPLRGSTLLPLGLNSPPKAITGLSVSLVEVGASAGSPLAADSACTETGTRKAHSASVK